MEPATLARTIERAKLHQVPELSLRHSNLDILPKNLVDLTDLTGLDLSDNQLTSLPDDLGNLTNLTWLNLDNNQLVSLPESLGKLTNLKRLSLYNNRLTTLPESIGNLSSLTRFNLYNNQLISLPISLSNLTSLTWMSLVNNPLTDLSILQNLINLKTLNFLDLDLPREYWIEFGEEMSGNILNPNNHQVARHIIEELEYTQKENIRVNREERTSKANLLAEQMVVQRMIDLAVFDRRLSLGNRNITNLPENIGNCTSLDYLNLSNNLLTELPDNIGNLINLTELSLYNNQLGSLPKSISNLAELTELDLSNNQLTSLSEDIGNLTNLAILNLYNNQLVSLPKTISNLTKLTELYLGGNQLTSLSGNIGYLVNLEYLDLTDNQLSELPKSIRNLRDLSVLSLRDNPLSDLSILKELPNLTRVIFLDDVDLPHRYWSKLSDWKSEWLLDEDNAEIRRILIEQLGYEKICDELNAIILDTWREYILLKIDGVEKIYDGGYEPVDLEPMLLLKMTCPSTMHIHILRVPPDLVSAEAAITWVNQGIHPDDFAVQT
jgi:leucine-rich repeat protein SHOC2